MTAIAQNNVGMNILETGADMSTINKVSGLVVGQYGVAVPLTVVDDEGIAIDLAAYTAVNVRSISPDARTTLQFTGSITSSSGGGISFTPGSSNTFDRDGTWKSQAQFSDTGVLALSVIFEMEVEGKI